MSVGTIRSNPWLRRMAMLPAAAMVIVLPMTPAAAAPGAPGAPAGDCVAGSAGWRAPVAQRYTITSPFGDRTDPIEHIYRLHAGVDLAMLPGPGPVVAADVGTVVRSGPDGGLGNEVTLDHGDGVQTLYGHMSRILPGIRPGTRVQAGQVLGQEGSTGTSTGPHLHFEVHLNGKPINPVPFMVERGAPLNGTAPAPSPATGFALPLSGSPRKQTLTQNALPVPTDLMNLYLGAAQKYGVPWPLLAGVGMEETAQGRVNHTSTAGAMGVMQFLPSTFARYGVDGNGDGRVDITSKADSVYSAANALRAWGVDGGATGVRRALFAYNHADWYVNDVLHYAAEYGGPSGAVACLEASAEAASPRAARAVNWADGQVGHAFRFGADGPEAWDSSAFVQAAYAKAGVIIPRSARQQRTWLAAGHGTRVRPGQERPGDLIFEDSYLGPDRIGFVMLVTDPQAQRALAARNLRLNVTYASYAGAEHSKHIFEIWRVEAPTKGSVNH